jgi:acyl-CoA thioester hydrolase
VKRRWPHYDPALAFTQTRIAAAHEIDRYGHVNNVVYLSWLDECAWAHAEALGLGIDVAITTARGMAVRAVDLEYRASVQLGDEVTVRTWIVGAETRFTGRRHFDIIGRSSTILVGTISYVMLDLKTLKPSPFNFAELERLGPAIATPVQS